MHSLGVHKKCGLDRLMWTVAIGCTATGKREVCSIVQATILVDKSHNDSASANASTNVVVYVTFYSSSAGKCQRLEESRTGKTSGLCSC